MPRFNPNLHHRHSIRLRGYDYSKEGAYFITICTQNRECLFGEIVDGRMVLNEAGRMIQSVWDELPQHYPGVDIDAFVIMPNHVHGIFVFENRVGAGFPCPEKNVQAQTKEDAGTAPLRKILGLVVAYFKYKTTKSINKFQDTSGCHLWQRNYYEHIIRNEDDLNRIREYIIYNPVQWITDPENPENVGAGSPRPK
ncbi:MAG: transposase [Proteobacteria bacterium]|nr:transposase [Pseudomonadota bacterium]